MSEESAHFTPTAARAEAILFFKMIERGEETVEKARATIEPGPASDKRIAA
jgi:hypothetical protein